MGRAQLDNTLRAILGSNFVYFQPPADLKMQFPAIVYQRDTSNSEFADNTAYSYTKRYQITVIDRDPDSTTPDKVAKLPLCTHSRFFVVNGLNHDVFSLYLRGE